MGHVQLFATLWTTAHQAPLFMGFLRQEYWRILEWVAFPSSNRWSLQPRDQTFISCVSCTADDTVKEKKKIEDKNAYNSIN